MAENLLVLMYQVFSIKALCLSLHSAAPRKLQGQWKSLGWKSGPCSSQKCCLKWTINKILLDKQFLFVHFRLCCAECEVCPYSVGLLFTQKGRCFPGQLNASSMSLPCVAPSHSLQLLLIEYMDVPGVPSKSQVSSESFGEVSAAVQGKWSEMDA